MTRRARGDNISTQAGVVELADTRDLKSLATCIRVRPPSPAPRRRGLRILRFPASGKAQSLRRASFQTQSHAWLCVCFLGRMAQSPLAALPCASFQNRTRFAGLRFCFFIICKVRSAPLRLLPNAKPRLALRLLFCWRRFLSRCKVWVARDGGAWYNVGKAREVYVWDM